MTRGTVTKLILLGNFLAVALVIWIALHFGRDPSPPPVNHCPPHDQANPWCGK
jgi:hypothetical protein